MSKSKFVSSEDDFEFVELVESEDVEQEEEDEPSDEDES